MIQLAPTVGQRRTAIAFLSTFGVAGLAAAQEPVESQIDEIVVVDSRIASERYRVGEQVTVDRDDIDALVPANVEQLLEQLPGISVNRPGGPGGVSEVFLRGAESNFTAVYLDGVRVNDPTNTRGGSFDFSTLATSELQRLDIAMGAMSALYGSDAMAGVIRMQSAWPTAGRSSLYGELGTDSAWRAGAAASLAIADEMAWSLRIATLDGGDEIAGSSHDLTSVASRITGERDNGDGWNIVVRRVDRERTSYPEVSGGPQFAATNELETADGSQTAVSAQMDLTLGDGWDSELVASWAEIADVIDTPAVPPGVLDAQPAFFTDSQYRRAEVLWVNRLDLGSTSDVAFGVDIVDENGRDDGSVDLGFAVVPNAYRLDRVVYSAFGELGHSVTKSLHSSVAVRADQFDGDTRVSGKAGIAVDFASIDGRGWARIASGFKLPSFFALGNPLFGNPDLVEEEVRSVELGWSQVLPGEFEYSLALYRSRFENLVDFDFETFTNVNRGRIDIDGLDVRLERPLGDQAYLAVDATVNDFSSSSGPLRRRPERTGGINLRWEFNSDWSLSTSARYIGSQLTTSIPTGDVTNDSYVSVDATLVNQASPAWSWWLAVDNAFDADYQDAPGFPAPGAAVRLGIRMER